MEFIRDLSVLNSPSTPIYIISAMVIVWCITEKNSNVVAAAAARAPVLLLLYGQFGD